MLVKIGPRGQITIPKSLRRSLGLKSGDSLAIRQVNDELLLQPITETLFDFIGGISSDKPVDFEAMKENARQHVAQKILKELDDV